MAHLFGRKWTRKQLMERVGNPEQLATLRRYELTEGKGKGVSAVDLSTGTGFRFTVLPDRGMDISAAEYCGRSLCWRSQTGETSPYLYQPENLEWLYSFFGGLLVTCGLENMGFPSVDEGRTFGIHGRASNTPAQEICVESGWDGDEYGIGVKGNVVESSVFGPCLSMNRTVFTFLGQNRLFIHDEVTNIGYTPAVNMMLYHVNLGFPIVDNGSRLICPSLTVTPRDDEAAAGKEQYASYSGPVANYKEKVYYHDVATEAGKTTAGIFNPALGFGAYVSWNKEQLPFLINWKMIGRGTYVVGIEPGTNLVAGRDKERAAGRLRYLKPGETAKYDLEIGALTSMEECVAFETRVKKLLGKHRTEILKPKAY